MRKFAAFLLILMSALGLSACGSANQSDSQSAEADTPGSRAGQAENPLPTDNGNHTGAASEMTTIQVIINGQEFEAELNDNEAARQFIEMLPLQLDMEDLHDNEKYFYFSDDFDTDDQKLKEIQYRLMSAWLRHENRRRYTLDYIMAQESRSGERVLGACAVRHDKSMHKWRLQIQLDQERQWFLSVFVHEDGCLDKYSLDKEAASDSHYEFQQEQEIRKKLYVSGDENQYFHEILIRYVKEHGGEVLRSLIMPYVTAQYHFD